MKRFSRILVFLVGILILSAMPIAMAQNPSIVFDKSSYTAGETINITAYSSKQGTIYLFDSRGIIKLTATISSQTQGELAYVLTSRENAGTWQVYLNDNAGTTVASDSAYISIPIVSTPTPVPTGLRISYCPSGVCSGVAWTIEDIFVWLRIYIPPVTGLVFIFYIIALFGSYKNIWSQ